MIDLPKSIKPVWEKSLLVLLFVVSLLPAGFLFPESQMPYIPVVVALGLAICLYAAYWLLGVYFHPIGGWFLSALIVVPLLWWLYSPKKPPKNKT